MSPRNGVRSSGSKYQNVRVEIDGLRFASKREARRYGDLLILLRIGEIADLELQPRYPLAVNGQKIATYVADFRYRLIATGSTVVEDVKGVRTPVYTIKKKLVRALYGVEIVEID